MSAIKSFVVLVLLFTSPLLFASPEIQSWELKNGTRVLFVKANDLPIVQIAVTFDAGSARDPVGKNGLSMMVAGMLEEGVVGMDADQIAAVFEDQGAMYNVSSSRDMLTLSLRSLSGDEYLEPVTAMFSKLMLAPTFPLESFERERSRALTGLKQSQADPGTLAQWKFFKAVYGDHPYAFPAEGTSESLTLLQWPDLAEFHKRYFNGSNAVMIMVGDLGNRQARSLAKEIAGLLPAGKKAPPLPDVVLPTKKNEQFMAFPSSQSHIQIGQPGMHRKDPDYFSLYVGNYILGGGGLVSRLSETIREKEGLAYSVYSYFWPLRKEGPFLIGMQTRNDQRDKAISLLRKILKDFVTKGPTEAELDAAKQNLTGGFPLRIDSNKKIAGYLNVIGFYNLPLTYLDDFEDRINEITVAKIKDAYKRRVHFDKLVTVVVGGKQ